MSDIKKNLSNLFADARSRIIILILLAFGIGALVFGLIKFFSSGVSVDEEGSALSSAPAIESIPGSINPTEQYAKLQAQQNVDKAKKAKATGGSSIPTIIRTEKFGEGNTPIGLKEGEGGVGFSTLSLGGESGRQQTWLDDLKSSQCAKTSVDFAVSKGATTKELLTACSCVQLKIYGFQFHDLVKGCKCKGLKEAGYKAKELKEQGNYTARQLRVCGYSACEMKAAGFSAAELKAAGYSDGELKGAGFSEEEIRAAAGLPPGVSVDDVKNAGCSPSGLRKLREQGVSAAAIRRISGCSIDQLKAAGFSAKELKDAGFTAAELKAAGFSAKDLRDAGFSAEELKAAGFSAAELKAAGFSAAELKDAGFSAMDLKAAGFSDADLKSAGFSDAEIAAAKAALAAAASLPPGVSIEDVRKAGCSPEALRKLRAKGVTAAAIRKISGCSVKQLKAAGYNAKELKDAGFTAAELKAAGFSAKELRDAGFSSVAANLPPGVSLEDVKKAGCSPAALKKLRAKGVTAAAIRKISGCSVEQLKAAGFSAKELKDAGFTAAELKAAGFSAAELKDAGFSARELKEAGFSISELKAAGFSTSELKDAGFSAADLEAAAGLPLGVSLEDVKKAGCSPAALRKLRAKGVTAAAIRKISGCSVKQLKAAGFSAAELKAAGFTAAELKAAGFSARELRGAGFSAEELKDAGFSAAELKDAGFSARELRDAGFSVAELKAAGFSAAALKSAGFSAEELKAAGFSDDELASAGFSIKKVKKEEDKEEDDEFSFIKDENLKKALAASKAKRGKIELAGQLKKIQGRMKAYAAKLEKTWISTNQEFVSDEDDEELAGLGLGGAIAGAKKKATGKGKGKEEDGDEEQRPAMIKAGDIHFAVLETAVNTDEPGPILARIAQGRFKNSKLIGSVSLPSDGQKAILKFTTMSIPGADNTITIDTVAIDLNTARTALSSRTDNHYFTRYGSLLASSFLEGFGKAITGVQTQINTTGGAVSTTKAAETTGEALYASLGTVGANWGEAIGEYTNKQATVYIYSGVGMGILFLQDVPPL